jgi:dUTP pyrophosphatase
MHACLEGPLTLAPNARAEIPSGVALAIPYGHVGLLMPRGGLGRKGLNLAHAMGVIDSNYRGEVMMNVVNTGLESLTIKPMDRILQLAILPIATCSIKEVSELDVTPRNDDRYGSSGS